MPMGETLMGRRLKKQRFKSQGLKKAVPRPPVVMASSKPCEVVARKSSRAARPPPLRNRQLAEGCPQRGVAECGSHNRW